MLEPQQIIDSLESVSRNVMLTEEQRLAASAAAHSLAVHAQLDQMWADRAKRCAEFERKRLESIRIVDYVRLHHPEIIESALKEAE
jgi:pantothenate synthetase